MVIASHNKSLLQLWCNRGIVMNSGKMVFEGKIEDCLKYYS